jgi:tetratricopeptide (TPR) repeat protein
MQGQSATPPTRASLWWTAALIAGLSLACYWPALRGGLLWDDDAHVTRPGLRAVSGLWQIWSDPRATQQYYPLLHSAFWAEHRLWGDATLGYHLANVGQHALCALLLVAALRRLRVPGAALAGVLFAVHPVCVESVAWISEQKNTLSLVFYLLSGLAYLRFDGERGGPGAGRTYGLASLLFVLALLTKSVTATLPAAILLVLWWQRGRISWRDVRPLVAWFAVAVASGLFTAHVERTLVGAQGAEFDLPFLQRLLLAGRIVWFYAGKLLWPRDLVFIYPHWDARSAGAGWAGYLAAAVAVTAALCVLARRSRGPLAAWLFFVGSLFPALGFFNVYPFLFSYVADHFQYLACMGAAAAAGAGLAALLGAASPALRCASWALAAALVATLVILSNAQSRIYVDQPTLYQATLQRNPACWMAHNNLGLWHEGRGELAAAVGEYEEAIRLKGDFASVHNNLGGLLRTVPGRADEAYTHILEAIRLQPDFPEAHNNLGVWYEDRGNLDLAVAQFQEALHEKPDYATAENNLGSVLARMPGRLEEAAAHFQEAVRLQPGFAEAHGNLGSAWLGTPGRLDDAIAEFEEAVRLRPGSAEARNGLANALSRKPERLNDAVAQFEEAIRLKPDYAEARNNLGLVLNGQGRAAEAIVQFKEALRLLPDHPEIRFNIALALLRTPGGANEAAGQLEALLQASPDNERARQLLARIRASQP